ncbi:hypothetical protein M1R94_07380 [Actinotalea sp. K2]|nr:hypothetical protein [Actinotalea sp. K2]
MFFVVLALVLIVLGGGVLSVAFRRRSRPLQAGAWAVIALGLIFAGAWMFGVV